MTAEQRAAFRRLIRSEIEENRYISEEKVDLIADYIDAGARLDDLRQRLANEIAAASPREVDKARLLALNTQINSLIGLRQKVGEKI
jgi:hypothetical protein